MPSENPDARQFHQNPHRSQLAEAIGCGDRWAIRQFGTALNSQSRVGGVLFGGCLGQRMVDEFTDLLTMAHLLDQHLW